MEKTKELLEIEKELSKTKVAYFEQPYIPHPTVEDAVESITLVGEGIDSWQTPVFVEAVIDSLKKWLDERNKLQAEMLDAYTGSEMKPPCQKGYTNYKQFTMHFHPVAGGYQAAYWKRNHSAVRYETPVTSTPQEARRLARLVIDAGLVTVKEI